MFTERRYRIAVNHGEEREEGQEEEEAEGEEETCPSQNQNFVSPGRRTEQEDHKAFSSGSKGGCCTGEQ